MRRGSLRLQPTAGAPDDGRAAGIVRVANRILIRDLELTASIGVYAHERRARQRVRINIELSVRDEGDPRDDLGNVVCYQAIVDGVKAIIADGHVALVETLAERIAGRCLDDPRAEAVRVRVEKLDAIPEAAAVGVEIERLRR